MKTVFISTIFVLIAFSVNAQSKGQIKELNIKSTTVWEYDYSAGKEQKKIESVEKFNPRGDVIELIDYDKSGKQKERIVYKYNSSNDIIEEIYYDHNDKLSKSFKYTYEGGLRKTKEKYDEKGDLLWKKVYVYEM